MLDLVAELDRTSRAVADGELNGAQAHVVELHRRLRAPVADVWDACTDPERVRRWFLPLTGDLRPGGTFQLEGNAGGTITQCDPPHRLEVTWECGDLEPGRVAIELAAGGPDTTEFVLRHTVADDEQWARFGPGATGVGWDAPVIALSATLTGESPAAQDFEAEFFRRSAAAWGRAHETAGTDSARARDTAERTADFYAPADVHAPADSASGPQD